ncbi:MAG: UMP kinase, partial [Candidatus Micrarchaeia archaeon]
MEEKIVLSLGGSLVSSSENKIDISFLKNFKKILYFLLKKRKKIALVVGGGKIARFYQKNLLKLRKNKRDLDQLGIILTWANAFLIKSLLGKKADLLNWKNKISFKKRIILLAGKEPGYSTD